MKTLSIGIAHGLQHLCIGLATAMQVGATAAFGGGHGHGTPQLGGGMVRGLFHERRVACCG